MDQTNQIMAQLRQCDEEVIEGLKTLLFNDDPNKVKKWHELFKDPIFFPR